MHLQWNQLQSILKREFSLFNLLPVWSASHQFHHAGAVRHITVWKNPPRRTCTQPHAAETFHCLDEQQWANVSNSSGVVRALGFIWELPSILSSLPPTHMGQQSIYQTLSRVFTAPDVTCCRGSDFYCFSDTEELAPSGKGDATRAQETVDPLGKHQWQWSQRCNFLIVHFPSQTPANTDLAGPMVARPLGIAWVWQCPDCSTTMALHTFWSWKENPAGNAWCC